MTNEEFAEWFEYHAAAFTGVESWLAKQGPNRRGAILIRWADVLKTVPLKVAKQITDKMFYGEIAEPHSFDRHPAVVRSAAKSMGAMQVQYGDSECICGGHGLLDVLADHRWKGKRKLEPGERFNHRTHLVTVACPCPKGQWINECRESSSKPGEEVHLLATYDADTMLLFTEWRLHRLKAEFAARQSMNAPVRDVSGIIADTAESLKNPETSNSTAV